MAWYLRSRQRKNREQSAGSGVTENGEEQNFPSRGEEAAAMATTRMMAVTRLLDDIMFGFGLLKV